MLPRLLSRTLCLAFMLCACVSAAQADPLYLVTITFDDRATGRTNNGSNLPSITSINSTGTRSGINVPMRFEFYVAPHAQATTQPNAAFGVGPYVGDPSLNGLEVSFSAGRTCFLCEPPPCNQCTNLVSLSVVGTQAGQTGAWQVIFYGVNGATLHTVSGTTDQFVTFSSTMQNIAFFRLYATSSNEGIDTISYNAPIPEPATLLLFGTGLAALGAARKRRRVSCKE
ncbi:MAG TPA: PEP-CTERM sorting domain-containing protein [Pyrinomonadaceae bacterium]|nr:PEP-CTERM sorting domain-containing protein [Pyrinomonadaceae bacterium]